MFGLFILDLCYNIIESVDSISRDGPDMPYICNTLQISKYLKIGNFVKFLSVKSESPANYLSNKTKIIHQINCSYMPEPDVQKNGHFSIFLSFFLFHYQG